MLLTFTLFTVFLSYCNAQSCKCGEENDITTSSSSKISGGTETLANAYPWVAYIQYTEPVVLIPQFFVEAGTLINNQWVVTSAQVAIFYGYGTTLNFNISTLSVYLGVHNVSDLDSSLGKFGVEKVILHKKLDITEFLFTKYNIALLKLDREINSTSGIMPICLPFNIGKLRKGVDVTAVGWGRTNENDTDNYYPFNKNGSEVLMETVLNFLPYRQCDKAYPHLNVSSHLPKTYVCADAPGTGTCTGDEGGPLMWKHPIKDAYYLIGILYGFYCTERAPVGLDVPTIAVDVKKLWKWIKKKTTGGFCIKY